MSLLRASALALWVLATPAAVLAQGTSVAFGAQEHDPSLPVEVSSDRLEVDQGDGSAVFIGNVVAVQGNLRLSTGKLRVEYSETEPRRITRLFATEGVTMVSGEEAAEAAEAVYTLDDRSVVMTGDVLLTQLRSAISGDRLTVDLDSGTGVMEGRVRTVLRTEDN